MSDFMQDFMGVFLDVLDAEPRALQKPQVSKQIHSHTYTHPQILASIHTHTHTYTHKHIQAHILTLSHTSTHAQVQILSRTKLPTHFSNLFFYPFDALIDWSTAVLGDGASSVA